MKVEKHRILICSVGPQGSLGVLIANAGSHLAFRMEKGLFEVRVAGAPDLNQQSFSTAGSDCPNKHPEIDVFVMIFWQSLSTSLCDLQLRILMLMSRLSDVMQRFLTSLCDPQLRIHRWMSWLSYVLQRFSTSLCDPQLRILKLTSWLFCVGQSFSTSLRGLQLRILRWMWQPRRPPQQHSEGPQPRRC